MNVEGMKGTTTYEMEPEVSTSLWLYQAMTGQFGPVFEQRYREIMKPSIMRVEKAGRIEYVPFRGYDREYQ